MILLYGKHLLQPPRRIRVVMMRRKTARRTKHQAVIQMIVLTMVCAPHFIRQSRDDSVCFALHSLVLP